MKDHGSLSQWLKERCREEHLSLRKLAARVGVSHVTITDAANGGRISVDTIKKLARAFSGDGDHQKLALEDKLLAFAGYRSKRPEDLTVPLAQLLDKVDKLNEAQVEMMGQFADFLRGRQGIGTT